MTKKVLKSIILRVRNGEPQTRIAQEYEVDPSSISKWKKQKIWKELEEEIDQESQVVYDMVLQDLIEKKREDFSKQLENWRLIEAAMAKRQASAARKMIEAINRQVAEIEKYPGLMEDLPQLTRFISAQVTLWEAATKTMHSALAFEELINTLEMNDKFLVINPETKP